MNELLSPAPLLAVLRELAADPVVTTARLAAAADLPEAAIAAAAEQLADHGVSRDAEGRWYSAAAIDLLDTDRIAFLLASSSLDPCPVDVRAVTGSTNDDARILLQDDVSGAASPRAVLAEAQVAGRGRRGRNWSSPVASNLYLTQIERLRGGPESARGLSLAVGVAVAEALERAHGLDVALKWPNDLIVEGRKLGGILVELALVGGHCHALIGVGVNVRLPAYVARALDQPWTDLATLGVPSPSRNETAAAIVAELRSMADAFRSRGFDARARARWQTRDPFFDRRILVTGPDGTFTGVERGIDESGELLVDTASGRRRLGAGEVSIRLVDDADSAGRAGGAASVDAATRTPSEHAFERDP